MTIALILALNVAAVTGLLAVLTAAMRLPYKLPTSPRAGATRQQEGRRRRRKTSPASRPSREGHRTPEPVFSR